MNYQAELVRPDNITRSGIIQPFNVVSQSPVTYARREINPFINAVRSQASQYSAGISIDGASGVRFQRGLGIVSPEVVRSLGQEASRSKWYWTGAALLFGLAGGFFMAKVL